jgi:hypothetical protein
MPRPAPSRRRRHSRRGGTALPGPLPPRRPGPGAQGVGRDGRGRHPHDFAQPDAAHVHEQLDVIAGMLGRQFRKLEAMLRDAAGVHRLPGQPLEEGLVDQSAGAAQHGSHLHHAAGRHPLRCSGTASAGRALGFRSRPSRQRHRLPAGRPAPTGSLSSNRKADIGGTHSLEAECDTAPAMAPSQVLAGVRRRIERAVADGAPEQLKCLLDSVVEQIVVEYRACIQPYFVAPTVRTRIRPRRRTGIEPA